MFSNTIVFRIGQRDETAGGRRVMFFGSHHARQASGEMNQFGQKKAGHLWVAKVGPLSVL